MSIGSTFIINKGPLSIRVQLHRAPKYLKVTGHNHDPKIGTARPDRFNLQYMGPGFTRLTSSVMGRDENGVEYLTIIGRDHLIMIRETIDEFLRQVNGLNDHDPTFLNDHDQAD